MGTTSGVTGADAKWHPMPRGDDAADAGRGRGFLSADIVRMLLVGGIWKNGSNSLGRRRRRRRGANNCTAFFFLG